MGSVITGDHKRCCIPIWSYSVWSCMSVCRNIQCMSVCRNIQGKMLDISILSFAEPQCKKATSDMCVKRRLKSACASAQSDQSLYCPHEETLHPWLSKMRPLKILIRLCECANWSEASLGAHVLLWNHAYSNIFKKFTTINRKTSEKNLIFFIFLLKT